MLVISPPLPARLPAPRPILKSLFRQLLGAGLLAIGSLAVQTHAEDANGFRPYMGFRYGEWNAVWNVHDLWGVSAGANLNRHWGVELNADIFQEFFDDGTRGQLGEESVVTFMPQVRYRVPLFKGRIVPYAIAGVGPAFMQFNDAKSAATGMNVEADGTVLSLAAGGGIDYFVMDNVALNVEGKYVWADPLTISVAGRQRELDASTGLMTIGLRIYFHENEPRPLALQSEPVPLQPYFGVRVGGSLLLDRRLAEGLRLGPLASSKLSGFSKAGGIALGLNLGDTWAAEVAIDNTEFNLLADPLGAVTEYAVYTVVPQVVLRKPLGEGRWVAYAQAGGGFCYSEVNDGKPALGHRPLEGQGVYPVVRADLGLERFIISNFSVNAGVRFFHTWGHDFEFDGTSFNNTSFSAFQVQMGFHVFFSRPHPAS